MQVAISVLLVGCSYAAYKLVKLNSQLGEFNGPKSNFIFGTTEFITSLANIHTFFQRWATQYGRIFRMRVLFTPMLVIASAKVGKEVLLAQNNYREDHLYGRGDYYTYQAVFGLALQNTENEPWAWRRKVLVPVFHQQKVLAFLPNYVTQLTHRLIEELKEKQGTIVTFDRRFMELTISVIAYYIFGREIDLDAISGLRPHIESMTAGMVSLNVPFGKYSSDFKKAMQSKQILRDFFIKEIQRAQSELDSGDECTGAIYEILKAEKYDLNALSDEIVALLLAGHDTTAHTMAFLLGLVADKPTIQQKIVKEFSSSVSDEHNITAKELANLTYLTGVIQETSRMFPLAWVVPIRNAKEVVLDGKQVPANTPMFLALCAIGRDPEFYPNPEEFIPERFVVDANELSKDDSATNTPSFTFSIGTHSCLGKSIALLETRLVCGLLLKHFRFELPAGETVKAEIKFTMQPVDGMRLIPFVRDSSSE